MIYVFNKNKIFSYVMACTFVLMLFSFHENITPNKEIELVKVSTNTTENVNIGNVTNNTEEIQKNENNY